MTDGIASIAGLGDATPLVTNSEPAQLGSFTIAGWDTTTRTDETAVFVLPDTNGDTSDLHEDIGNTATQVVLPQVKATCHAISIYTYLLSRYRGLIAAHCTATLRASIVNKVG